jgi:hypothetical protein
MHDSLLERLEADAVGSISCANFGVEKSTGVVG